VLSSLLLSAGQQRPLWREVGVGLVAVDTLVHNFLDHNLPGSHRDRLQKELYRLLLTDALKVETAPFFEVQAI